MSQTTFNEIIQGKRHYRQSTHLTKVRGASPNVGKKETADGSIKSIEPTDPNITSKQIDKRSINIKTFCQLYYNFDMS